MKRNLIAVALFLSATGLLAMDPVSLTNAAVYIQKTGLESEHAAHEVMSDAARSNGWSERDCADVLLLAYELFHSSTNAYEKGCSRHAISLLETFGGTNALPGLVSIMQKDDGVPKRLAGQGYLRISTANPFPGWAAPLRKEIEASSSRPDDFAWNVYRVASLDLEYACSSPLAQRNLLRFLLDQTAVEQNESAFLDEILCREVPRWRASPQRAANAAKMLREHPGDAALAAFFEGVRADATKAAADTRAADATNALQAAASRVDVSTSDTHSLDMAKIASTKAPAASAPKAASSDAEADPWADLLADLPEKKPWVPPAGEPAP